jgi:outer membrane autotransporter protein
MLHSTENRAADIPSVTLPASQFIDGPYVVPGADEALRGHFPGRSLSGHFETGYRNTLGEVNVTPFVGLEFDTLKLDSFVEKNGTAPSAIGLNFHAQNVNSLPSFLGVQFDGDIDVGQAGTMRTWIRAAWKHEFDAGRSTDASFIAAPGFDFSVRGAEPPHDAATTSLGVKLMIDQNMDFFGGFGGDFAAGSHDYSGTGGLRITW